MANETTTVALTTDATTVVYDSGGTTVAATVEATTIVATGSTGPEGPAGATGATGATGASGGSYLHDQSVPASTWTITHNLGYRPAGITVIDSGGTVVEGSIAYPDGNTVTLTFSSGFAGTAYLS